MKERNYIDVYNDFWKEIIEPNGVIDMDALMRELSDYEFMLDQVPKVYDELTGGRISKPNTYAFEVIREANDSREESMKEMFWDDIEMIADGIETKTELLEKIKEYLTE